MTTDNEPCIYKCLEGLTIQTTAALSGNIYAEIMIRCFLKDIAEL